MKKLQLERIREIFSAVSEAEDPLISYNRDTDIVTFLKEQEFSISLLDIINSRDTSIKVGFYTVLDYYFKNLHSDNWVSMSSGSKVKVVFINESLFILRDFIYYSDHYVFFYDKSQEDLQVLHKLNFLLNYRADEEITTGAT